MSRNYQLDIILELLELNVDVVNEIRQQLAYFSASVYKQEAASQVKVMIDRLRAAMDIIPDDLMKDPFMQYDAELAMGHQHFAPGECSFTSRVTRLIQNLEQTTSALKLKYTAEYRDYPVVNDIFAYKLQRHKGAILAACQQGSRSWNFFQSCS
jgi:hypothetical protein